MNLFSQPPQPHTATEPPRAASVASSRATDPQTSKDAAAAHEASGKATCNRWVVLRELRRAPMRTAGEIASQIPGIDHVEVCRRMPELAGLGFAETVGRHRCSVRGTGMREWSATLAGQKAGPSDV